jgi:predicted enzyme related to lactoylglutathione lyase
VKRRKPLQWPRFHIHERRLNRELFMLHSSFSRFGKIDVALRKIKRNNDRRALPVPALIKQTAYCAGPVRPVTASSIATTQFGSRERRSGLANDPGFFTWYELMTTDVMAAAAFYRDVVGWGTASDSTSRLPYMLFTTGDVPAAGLMELPEEGRKMGAMPRWMGYVGVRDVHAAADRIKRLGGAVYVPPTDTNIGRISVVADPHTATFGVVDRLEVTPQLPTDSGKLGHIGWHELFATDLDGEVAFYCELFGWQKAHTENHLAAAYVSLSCGGLAVGGAFKKPPKGSPPFWLFYVNVEDLDAAAERVRAGGGEALHNDEELPGGFWVTHCVDPQGAAFALQGKKAHSPKVGWSTEWQGFSSRGQLVAPKPRRKSDK